MRCVVHWALLISWAWQSLLFAEPTYAQAMAKMEIVDLGELPTGRQSKINLWFPQGKCGSLSERQYCLADNAITDKVIVFSHGAMGSAIEYSWIGEGLAAAGYVVVGINHFGEARIYGEDSTNPRSTALIWQRPQDISAVLDWFGQQQLFQKPVNWSSIVAIGHSSGGQTVSMLVGATFDLKLLMAYCASPQSQGDLSCHYGTNSASAPAAFQQQFSEQRKDARIRLAVMLDPALGSAVNIASLHDIKVPSLVVGAQNNDFLPWTHHGLRYASAVPNVSLKLLTGQEGHFVFLSQCSHAIQVMGVSLCEDRPSVDRALVHKDLLRTIIEFIQS
jgi:predicted dienelactone hydrolase